MQRPHNILIASLLLFAGQTVGDVSAVFHLTEPINTEAGTVPPCTPLQLTTEDLKGKKVELEDTRQRWGNFKLKRKTLEQNSYPTFADCVANTRRYAKHFPMATLTSFDGETLTVGMPYEFADIMLGPVESLGLREPTEKPTRVWSKSVGRSAGSVRYAGPESASVERLRAAESVALTIDLNGTIQAITLAEDRNALAGALPHRDQDTVDRTQYFDGLALYERGDHAAAFRAWMPLAEADHAPAQYSVADLYYRGEGVERDLSRAVEWFQRAADFSFPSAQYHLGFLYATGEGVPLDLVQAYRWMDAAKRLGHEQAAEVRKRIEKQMLPEELEAAKALVQKMATTNPILLTHLAPPYPELARTARMEGRVILQAVIDTEGRVIDPVILSCTRKGVGFEFAAIQAVMHWRYEPAMSNGKPVPVYFTIVVTFSLN